jgi:hypothetical protein
MLARATTEPDVSGAMSRAVAAALSTDGTADVGSADANLTDPALTWTVFTRTGFIGSVEPGTASIGWVAMTPLVKGAGSGLVRFGGSAAVEAAISERARRAGRSGGSATGSGGADAVWMAPSTCVISVGRERA